jgi:hypothetical protein
MTTSDMSLRLAELPSRSQRYRHFSLDKRRKDIRLIQIKADPVHNSALRLFMKTANLESISQSVPGQIGADREFIALSYTWGPETPSSDILIEDSITSGWFSIRQNLYDFLKTKRDSTFCSSWFWIDQLCINQADDQERGHQVRRMSQIYSTAVSVEVWLGLGFEGSDEAMDFIRRLGMHRKHRTSTRTIISRWTKEEEIAHTPALIRIGHLPYWSRLWIVQEVLLGRNITIRLGNKTAPWPYAFGYFHRIVKATSPTYDLWVTGMFESSKGHHWASVLPLAKYKACTEVRDRVFAMMGLVVEPLRFYPLYSMHLQDILLMLLRKQTEYLLLDLSMTLTDASPILPGRFNIDEFAQEWYWVLNQGHQEIDPKVVRQFLLNHVYPALRNSPYGNAPTTNFITRLRSGRTLTRLRLWWEFPDRNRVKQSPPGYISLYAI